MSAINANNNTSRVLALLSAAAQYKATLTTEECGKLLDMPKHKAQAALVQLYRDKKIERLGRGSYRVATAVESPRAVLRPDETFIRQPSLAQRMAGR